MQCPLNRLAGFLVFTGKAQGDFVAFEFAAGLEGTDTDGHQFTGNCLAGLIEFQGAGGFKFDINAKTHVAQGNSGGLVCPFGGKPASNPFARRTC